MALHLSNFLAISSLGVPLFTPECLPISYLPRKLEKDVLVMHSVVNQLDADVDSEWTRRSGDALACLPSCRGCTGTGTSWQEGKLRMMWDFQTCRSGKKLKRLVCDLQEGLYQLGDEIEVNLWQGTLQRTDIIYPSVQEVWRSDVHVGGT